MKYLILIIGIILILGGIFGIIVLCIKDYGYNHSGLTIVGTILDLIIGLWLSIRGIILIKD